MIMRQPFFRAALTLAMPLAMAACNTFQLTSQGKDSSASLVEADLPDTSHLIPTGWREHVISVSDLDEMEGFFTGVLGWEVRASGLVPRGQLEAWNLPREARARYALVANPGSETGFVRILDFDGVDQVRVREHDQAWETGGIYNMNIRVSDMATISAKITDAGWQAPSAPINFIFGPYDVWEWIPRHKDGVRIAFVERVTPPLENYPHLKTTSRIFNSTQIVADHDRAAAFYQGVLGFKTFLHNHSASAAPGQHVLGLSAEAMTDQVREVSILNPTSENDGSVEVLKFGTYTGRDFSARAVPPNLGNLMLRYPVPDLEALAEHLAASGVELTYAPVETELAPYGRVRMLGVRSPDGAWLEFYETLD